MAYSRQMTLHIKKYTIVYTLCIKLIMTKDVVVMITAYSHGEKVQGLKLGRSGQILTLKLPE